MYFLLNQFEWKGLQDLTLVKLHWSCRFVWSLIVKNIANSYVGHRLKTWALRSSNQTFLIAAL